MGNSRSQPVQQPSQMFSNVINIQNFTPGIRSSIIEIIKNIEILQLSEYIRKANSCSVHRLQYSERLSEITHQLPIIYNPTRGDYHTKDVFLENMLNVLTLVFKIPTLDREPIKRHVFSKFLSIDPRAYIDRIIFTLEAIHSYLSQKDLHLYETAHDPLREYRYITPLKFLERLATIFKNDIQVSSVEPL